MLNFESNDYRFFEQNLCWKLHKALILAFNKSVTTMFYAFAAGRNRTEKEQKDHRKHSLRAGFGSPYYYDGYENEMDIDHRLLNIEKEEIRYFQ